MEWPTLRKISGLDEDKSAIPWFFHLSNSLKIKWFKISASLWRHQSFYTSLIFQNWPILSLILTEKTQFGLLKTLRGWNFYVCHEIHTKNDDSLPQAINYPSFCWWWWWILHLKLISCPTRATPTMSKTYREMIYN